MDSTRRWVRLPLALFILLCAGATHAANAVHTIYLVRHGAYLPDSRADPQAGPGLSTLGIAQARMIATRLRAMPIAFDSVTSSTLARAQQTAAIMHEQIADADGSASPLLSECTPPAAALKVDEVAANACRQRLDTAFAAFFKTPSDASRYDVLVCHGNVIRYFVTKALGVDTRAWPAMSVAHASLTIIEVHRNGAMRLVAVGDIGHVPPPLQSWGDDSDPQLATPGIESFATPK